MCRHEVFAHAKSVYEIELDFYISNKIKYLFLDLDNTLDSYKLYHPTGKAVKLIKDLISKDIKPIIISNNKGKRVTSYANDLHIEFVCSSRKPFSHKISKFIKDKGINKEEIMMIGDQMVTDIGAANNLHIKGILTDKIVKEDQWTTHFNRIFDRIMRKNAMRKGKLVDWRDKYGSF